MGLHLATEYILRGEMLVLFIYIQSEHVNVSAGVSYVSLH